MPNAELLAIGREELARYNVELVWYRAVDVTRDGGFAVSLAGGRTVGARRYVVTTGLEDDPPPVPGVAERHGRDALHRPHRR